jgi:hypothetical protein
LKRFINYKVASIAMTLSASTFAVDVAGFYQSEEIAYNDFNDGEPDLTFKI